MDQQSRRPDTASGVDPRSLTVTFHAASLLVFHRDEKKAYEWTPDTLVGQPTLAPD
jgi:hypothetical protein